MPSDFGFVGVGGGMQIFWDWFHRFMVFFGQRRLQQFRGFSLRDAILCTILSLRALGCLPTERCPCFENSHRLRLGAFGARAFGVGLLSLRKGGASRLYLCFPFSVIRSPGTAQDRQNRNSARFAGKDRQKTKMIYCIVLGFG